MAREGGLRSALSGGALGSACCGAWGRVETSPPILHLRISLTPDPLLSLPSVVEVSPQKSRCCWRESGPSSCNLYRPAVSHSPLSLSAASVRQVATVLMKTQPKGGRGTDSSSSSSSPPGWSLFCSGGEPGSPCLADLHKFSMPCVSAMVFSLQFCFPHPCPHQVIGGRASLPTSLGAQPPPRFCILSAAQEVC